MTDENKNNIVKLILQVLIVFVIALSAAYGYDVTIEPRVNPDSTPGISGTRGTTGLDTLKVTGLLKGPAEGSVVYSTRHVVTRAEVNAGHTLATVPANVTPRLVDVKLTPYGGACTAVTTIDLRLGTTVLVTYAQANLTQSNLLLLGSTGVTKLADGASFTPGAAGEDFNVIKAGSDVTTCTGIIIDLAYALD